MFNALAIILHLLAINIWVGGTFFSVMILARAAANLSSEARHPFMSTVFKGFFFWIWLAVVVVISSGLWMIISLFHGFNHVPVYVILMMSLALMMVAIFFWIFFIIWPNYQQAIAAAQWHACEQQLARIKFMSMINMVLGICVVLVIGGGPHFFN